MIRYVLPLLAPLLLGLGGCGAGGMLSGAAGALGVQALTIGGQGTVRAIEQDIAAAQRWTGRHEALVAVYLQACQEHALRLEDWSEADAAFDNCLVKSVEHMPTLLIERVKMRIDRSVKKEGTEAQLE